MKYSLLIVLLIALVLVFGCTQGIQSSSTQSNSSQNYSGSSVNNSSLTTGASSDYAASEAPAVSGTVNTATVNEEVPLYDSNETAYIESLITTPDDNKSLIDAILGNGIPPGYYGEDLGATATIDENSL